VLEEGHATIAWAQAVLGAGLKAYGGRSVIEGRAYPGVKAGPQVKALATVERVLEQRDRHLGSNLECGERVVADPKISTILIGILAAKEVEHSAIPAEVCVLEDRNLKRTGVGTATIG
jgi:hypothetical protein